MATVRPIAIATAGFITNFDDPIPLTIASRGFLFPEFALPVERVLRKRVGAGPSVYKKPTQRPDTPQEMVDLLFKTCIVRLNEENYEEEEMCEIKKYHIPKKLGDGEIKIENFGVKTKKEKPLGVKIEGIKSRTFEKHISSSKDPKKIEFKNIRISSSYQKLKPYISSSLQLNKPKSFIFTSNGEKVKKKTK